MEKEEATPRAVLEAKRVVVDPAKRAVYACPVCGLRKSTLAAIRNHAEVLHGSTVVGPRGAKDKSIGMVEGDTVVVGPTPSTPVTVAVSNGHASRKLLVYVLPMGDVFDVIAGAVRQAVERGRR